MPHTKLGSRVVRHSSTTTHPAVSPSIMKESNRHSCSLGVATGEADTLKHGLPSELDLTQNPPIRINDD